MFTSSRFSKVFLYGVAFITCIFAGCRNKEEATVTGPVRVRVMTAGNSAVNISSREYSGTVEAARSSTVSFSVAGTIISLNVEEGQKVSKGQLLARIKSENLVNSRNIAQAELEEARDAYQRMKKLHDANALPDIKWVEIQAKLKQAENAAALADRAVGDAALYAPISGYVTTKFADAGQTVMPAEPIVKIVSLNNLQIAISVPENEISSFGTDVSAIVKLDGEGIPEVSGRLSHKEVVADPLTRSYTVKFDIDNVSGKILPGMIGSVSANRVENDSTGANAGDITLPSQAVLLSADNRQFVWIVKNGKAARKYVIADELSTKGVTVKSGLTPGDSVITAGMEKVGTGTPVTVTK